VIRDLRTDDWGAVALLLGQETEYGKRLARHVESTYRPSFGWVLLANDANRVDGAVVAGVRRRSSDGSAAAVSVAWIGVCPPRRRLGIGRHLIDRVLVGASRLGARRLEASVNAGDARGLAFFEATGFEIERRTAEVRIAGSDASTLAASMASPDVVVRPLRHDEVPSLTGLLIHLAVERATDPHDDLDGLTPSVLSAASMHMDFIGAAAWEADDPGSPVGIAWGSRRADGVHIQFIGVHQDARRRGTGRALVGALLTGARRTAVLARVHEPVALHGFLVRIGAVVTTETVDLARPIGANGDGML
jgi:ribosomal protein S18 acetylase RimI-like enzyme